MNQINVMKRYIRELVGASVIYAIVLVASITLLEKYEFPRAWQVIVSITPSIPVAFVILAIMRLLVNSDELQQRIQLYATAFSAALTGFITFSYGFLENVGFPKFPTFFIFPMLITIWGVSLGYFTRKYQ